MLTWYFEKLEKYVTFNSEQWGPQLVYWKRILNIGLPAGGEFFLMFHTHGPHVLAHSRLRLRRTGRLRNRLTSHAIDFPACDAVAFSAAPVAGQNFGGAQTRSGSARRSAPPYCSNPPSW